MHYEKEYYLFAEGKECLMSGWGVKPSQLFSKKRKFLHVTKTQLYNSINQCTSSNGAVLSLDDSVTIVTKPDLGLSVK